MKNQKQDGLEGLITSTYTYTFVTCIYFLEKQILSDANVINGEKTSIKIYNFHYRLED